MNVILLEKCRWECLSRGSIVSRKARTVPAYKAMMSRQRGRNINSSSSHRRGKHVEERWGSEDKAGNLEGKLVGMLVKYGFCVPPSSEAFSTMPCTQRCMARVKMR